MDDSGLVMFRAMLRAQTLAELLSGLIEPQFEFTLRSLPPDGRAAIRSACQLEDPGARALGRKAFDQLAGIIERRQAPGELRGLAALRVDRAAFELAIGMFEVFNSSLLQAFEAAAASRDHQAILQTIDMAWPLVWFRLSKYDCETLNDTNHAAVLGLIARRADSELAPWLALAVKAFGIWSGLPPYAAMQGLEPGPAALRSPMFVQSALPIARQVDQMYGRWDFESIVSGSSS